MALGLGVMVRAFLLILIVGYGFWGCAGGEERDFFGRKERENFFQLGERKEKIFLLEETNGVPIKENLRTSLEKLNKKN